MQTLTRPKFKITIDMADVLDRLPKNDDAKREVITAIRDWCDRAEEYGLSGNIVTRDRRIIGKANLPRRRHVAGIQSR